MIDGRDDDDGDTVSVTPAALTETNLRRGEACLVVIYGPELGRRIPLAHSHFEIGRSSKSDLSIDQESISRHHARIAAVGGGTFTLMDLGSTNGTYVNDVSITEHRLADGDQIKIGRSILKFMTGDNIETSYHEEIYRLVTVDALTQLFNKRYFGEALEREFNRARRYKRHLSLFLLDLDHFKHINDHYGHVAGDFVLRQLAVEVKAKLRREDIFARVGGEEFGVLLPEVRHEGALATAEKVRKVVEAAQFTFDKHTIRGTVSIGVATLDPALFVPGDEDSADDDEETDPDPSASGGLANGKPKSAAALYALADAALYQAKERGRNRVEAA
ncbi:GGDEF domain-containing protein [Pendulispora rubella]|uniref:diguanylate cyclase n=1 Tax=Pendulispora rubella TaxID=2741070 RepID=A0ABZ2L748_9BACT